MAKEYTVEYIAKVYEIDPVVIHRWSINEMGGKAEKIGAFNNNSIAQYIGKPVRSLKKKKLKLIQDSTPIIERPHNITFALEKVKNGKWKENVKELVEKLIFRNSNNKYLSKEIKELYEQLPLAEEYKSTYCSKVYFTWADMTFSERSLKVDPNKLFLSIKLEGPLKILSEIQESYFRERFKRDLYKVYVSNSTGQIEYGLSPDISKIKGIVEKHIHRKKKTGFGRKKEETANIIVPDKISWSEPQKMDFKSISEYFAQNKYIQKSAELLKHNGEAIALWENNNNKLEESLLIILKHKIYSYVLWENINEDRACYIFKFTSRKFEEKVGRLKDFISSDARNKREDLFRNYSLEGYGLMHEDYCTIIHENPGSYKQRINYYLSPLFAIK